MARPQKEGLDYFSLDVDMDQDDKIRLIEARFKLTGFAIVIKLLMKIYKEGYFYKWTEREQLLFADYIHEELPLVTEVINEAIKWELFNPELYTKYQILTSSGIQKRYLQAVKKRSEIAMLEEYFLVEEKDIPKNTSMTLVNVEKTLVNSSETTSEEGFQATLIPKEKESKVKKSKVKDIKPEIIKNLFGEKVLLSDEEYKKLVEQHGEEATRQMISILDNWYLTKGNKPNKSDYHTMVGVGWVLKRLKDDQQRQRNKDPGDKPPRSPKASSKYDKFYL